MTTPAEAEDLRLNAYIDGELDPLASRDFEVRLAAEPKLAAEFARLLSLRAVLRADIGDDLPSPALARRIEAGVGPPARFHVNSWGALAASLLLGAFIGAGVTFGVIQSPQRVTTAEQVVGAHVRALMSTQPFDIASSDRHAVKPWFDGKLAFAPDVIDLAAEEFPLAGGRIDVVDLQPVPALVYRAGKHLISLIEIPGAVASRPLTRTIERGFEALSWADSGVTYWAISDASDEALEGFVKALRAARSVAPTDSSTGQ